MACFLGYGSNSPVRVNLYAIFAPPSFTCPDEAEAAFAYWRTPQQAQQAVVYEEPPFDLDETSRIHSFRFSANQLQQIRAMEEAPVAFVYVRFTLLVPPSLDCTTH